MPSVTGPLAPLPGQLPRYQAFFELRQSDRWHTLSQCGFNLHFPNYERLFTCFWAICISFFVAAVSIWAWCQGERLPSFSLPISLGCLSLSHSSPGALLSSQSWVRIRGGVGQDTIAPDQEPHHSQWWLEPTSMAGQVEHIAQACFAGERALLIPNALNVWVKCLLIKASLTFLP